MKYWISVFGGEEDLEEVFKECSGRTVFLISSGASPELFRKVALGISKAMPKEFIVYDVQKNVGEELNEIEALEFDKKAEESWIPIRPSFIGSTGATMAAPLLTSERVILLCGISPPKKGALEVIRSLFRGVDGSELKAYILFRPDFTIYEIMGEGIIVSNSKILAEIALDEVLVEMGSSSSTFLKELIKMEAIPKEFYIKGKEKVKEKILARIREAGENLQSRV